MSNADRGSLRRNWPWLAIAAALLVVASILAGIVLRGFVFSPGDGDHGGDGVGDRYFPTAGGGGYDAQHYRIEVTYSESDRTLSGNTTMTAAPTQNLSSFHLDLDLPVSQVEVNGVEATFEQSGRDLRIEPNKRLSSGEEFQVRVSYSGRPEEVSKGVRVSERDLVIADEPFSAPAWFPSNDHPSDPATMEALITVPADLQVLTSGSLISRDIGQDSATDTWHWRSPEPMATYLNFLAIGPYDIHTGDADGRPYLYAISRQLDPNTAQRAEAALRTTPEFLADLEAIWGPYPFSEIGGIAPSTRFPWGALETQPRPVYNTRTLVSAPEILVIHEYAHMWFGNKVTLAQWDDIVMNEAYASYSEWMVAERRGVRSANDSMKRMYASAPEETWTVPIDDPGVDQLFDNVYTRGPMALQALRNLIGDDTFFALSREWTSQTGPHSFEQWQELTKRHAGTDLDHYFQVWFSGTTKPEQTAENGFR